MKKVVSLVLALFLCFAANFGLVVSADENLTIASKMTQNEGGNYTVEVAISKNPGIGSLTLIIATDDALKISALTGLNTLGAGTVSGKNISWSFDELNNKTGVIAKFIVSVSNKKDVGEKNIFITGTATGKDGANVNVNSVSQKVKIECKNHNFTNWTTIKRAKCNETGTKQRTCNNCGFIEEVEIPFSDHTYTKWTTVEEPGCDTTGLKTAICTVCGEEGQKEVEPVGHSFKDGNTIQNATLWSEGIQNGTCVRCEQVQTQTITPNDYHVGTGVRVQAPVGAFEENTKLFVSLYGSLSEEYASYKQYIDETVTDYMVYNIAFTIEDKEVAPKETIRLAMPFKFAYTKDTVLLYQFKDGELLPVEYTNYQNYVIVDTNEAGIYIITDATPKKEKVEETPIVPDFEVNEVSSWIKLVYVVVAGVAIIFLAVITFLTVRKR